MLYGIGVDERLGRAVEITSEDKVLIVVGEDFANVCQYLRAISR